MSQESGTESGPQEDAERPTQRAAGPTQETHRHILREKEREKI